MREWFVIVIISVLMKYLGCLAEGSIVAKELVLLHVLDRIQWRCFEIGNIDQMGTKGEPEYIIENVFLAASTSVVAFSVPVDQGLVGYFLHLFVPVLVVGLFRFGRFLGSQGW